MASIGKDTGGKKRILFVSPDGKRKTIYLGKCSLRDAETCKIRVENLLSAVIQGKEPSRDDAQWLDRISSIMHDRLAKVGLVEPKEPNVIFTVHEWTENYIKSRTGLKVNTIANLNQAFRSLKEYLSKDKNIKDFTPEDAANFRLHLLNKGLQEATVRRRTKRVKQFFSAAIKQEIISKNPFDDVPTANRTNPDRQRYISRDNIQQVIDACPDAQWRLIFALARYGGLRIPSELFGLKWEGVIWDKGRFVVYSPKTEHIEGRAYRVVPIFPELEPYLLEVSEQAKPGESRVITIYNEKNCNLRTQAHRIIKRAGFNPWPKPFQNLRSSRETELVEDFPIHVVTAWLGNSPEVAQKHYLQVTEEHFQRAAQNPAQNPAQNTAQQGFAGPRSEWQEKTEKKTQVPVIAGSCETLLNRAITETYNGYPQGDSNPCHLAENQVS